MPNTGENFNSFTDNTGEASGEIDARVARERGEKANEAAAEKSREEKLAELAALRQRYMAERARGEKIMREIERRTGENTATAEAAPSDSDAGTTIEGAIDSLDNIAGSEVSGDEIIEDIPEGEPEGDSSETAENVPENTEATPEATRDKAKKNLNFKKVIMVAAPVALAAAVLIGSMIGGKDKGNDNNAPEQNPTTMEYVVDGETAEAEKGIYDGYGEKGMWLAEGKTSAVAFAEAGQVGEVCNNDEVEMMKYAAHNQVETFADYMANLPEALQPEGFKGLNLAETEAKLESLSPEDFEAIEAAFGGIMDNAFTRRVTLNGTYDNAFMRQKDASGAVVHENMELVRCATQENGTEATEFYWVDANGNEIGSMTVKMSPVYDADGNITSFKLCMQVVNEPGNEIYEGIPEIPSDPEDPSEPTPIPVVTPTPAPETPDTPDTPTPAPETPTPETPTPETPTPETPTPETPAPKDPENMTRIDNQIQQDIAEDIGTEQVVVHQETAAPQDVTTPPPAEAYEGTAPTIVENEAAPAAEAVQEQVSEANNYSENRGGANANEYAPVQENQAAQQAANAAETPIEQAPSASDVGTQEVEDYLAGLGL